MTEFITLEQPYAGRVAKLLIELLNRHHDGLIAVDGKELHFDMGSYCRDSEGASLVDPYAAYTCGATCCVMGLAVHVFPEVRKLGVDNWRPVERWMLGDTDTPAWDFLFSSVWPSDAGQAARRALRVLRGEVPPAEVPDFLEDDWIAEGGQEPRYLEEMTDTEVIGELCCYVEA